MASHPDTVTTADEQSHLPSSPNSTRSRTSSLFRNRFSNASLLSLSSVRTLLPQYSVVDTFSEPPASQLSGETCASSSWHSSSATVPPRYSLAQHRQSLLLTRRLSTATSFDVEGGPDASDEFRYSYPIKPKNPWATLHLQARIAVPGTHSNSLQHQPRLPRFWSCDPITGTVQLDLESPQNIQRITVTVNGTVVLSSHSGGSLPFLRREFTVWDKSMSDPLQSGDTDLNSTEKQKNDTRLASGRYTFPFSFPLPTHADSILNTELVSPLSLHTSGTGSSPTSDNGPKNTEKRQRRWIRPFTSSSDVPPSFSAPHASEPRHSFAPPIPQTFMEKDIDPNVAYDLSVRIVHGRFKTSSKIKTNFTYFPASEPLPMPQKRREAYEAGALVPSPMNDPEGWFALPMATTYGMVEVDDNLKPTKVDCTLYIAQPLSYTRGSPIPCFITIHSDDGQIAHLLPNTEMPTVRLLRRVSHPLAELQNPSAGHDPADTTPMNCTWAHLMVPTSDMTLVTHQVGRANWWIPSKEVVQDSNTRHLEGEIHLSPDLQPSCGFPSFRIEYFVELLAFQTATFTPEVHSPSPGKLRTGPVNVVASNPVEITMLYRQDEPVPTAYSVPPKTYHKRRLSSDKAGIFEND